MRIGILTYHRSHNCGALLQAYALREFLKLKGITMSLMLIIGRNTIKMSIGCFVNYILGNSLCWESLNS